MAIEFLRAQVLTRGKSVRGVPAHMAYRACAKVYDQKADRTFNYERKNSVLEVFLVNAGGNDFESLANKMEAAEKRKDAQVAREFIVALPHELSLSENRKICEAFVDLMVKKYQIAAQVAIHKPDELRSYETHRSRDSLKNIHAHITVSTRAIDKNGNIFGPKIREMNDRKYLENLKEKLRKMINETLKNAGFNPMEMRDITQEGTHHLGAELTRLERRGGVSEKGEINRNIEKLNENMRKYKQLSAEIEVLREGNITVDGVTFKHFPYPKGMEYKPYKLAFMSENELKKELQKGNLRVEERYDNGLIHSLSYYGQSITIAELALINFSFPNKELAKIEQKLSEKIKEIDSKIPKNKDHHRRKKYKTSIKKAKYTFQMPINSKPRQHIGTLNKLQKRSKIIKIIYENTLFLDQQI